MAEEGEPVTDIDAEQITGFMDTAKEALGFDIPTLLSGMMEANAEDATFRAEVIKRFDVLIDNQLKIYTAVMALGKQD